MMLQVDSGHLCNSNVNDNVINLSTKCLNSVRYFTSSSFTQEHFMSLSAPVPTTDLAQIQRII